jgi:hypothetical protein
MKELNKTMAEPNNKRKIWLEESEAKSRQTAERDNEMAEWKRQTVDRDNDKGKLFDPPRKE